MGIGNIVGWYVKSSEARKKRKYTSYARICVYIDISKALSGLVTLEYQDEDWNQTIDYEHIMFHRMKCHENNHLFWDCPLNAQIPKARESKKKEGFTIVTGWKRNLPQKHNQDNTPKITTKNSYDILNQLSREEEVQYPHKMNNQEKEKGQSLHQSDKCKEDHPGDKPDENGDTLMQLDKQDQAYIDLEKVEEALNRKDLHTIPMEQLRKVHKVFIDSTAGSTSRLGISLDPATESKHTPWENKRQGHKSTH